ncbi:MAG TPA: GNAT family N-acetyltransferase [Ohtaekwangia sp.]|nr:GNAT family N-acetyltransferase [Ohtaekwangia sp.]
MNSISIRAFRKEDLPHVVEFHKAAFKDHINARLGNAYLTRFLSWFINQEKCIAFVAVDEKNQPIGYVVGAYWGYQQRLNRFLLGRSVVAMITHPVVLFHPKIWNALIARVKILLGLSKHVEETQKQLQGNIISLVGIGVDTKLHRGGVGTMLLKTFETKATEINFDTLRLSVYSSNKTARSFYEKNGWFLLQDTAGSPIVAYAKKCG